MCHEEKEIKFRTANNTVMGHPQELLFHFGGVKCSGEIGWILEVRKDKLELCSRKYNWPKGLNSQGDWECKSNCEHWSARYIINIPHGTQPCRNRPEQSANTWWEK